MQCGSLRPVMQALAVALAQLEPVTLVRRWQLTAETRKGKSVTGELPAEGAHCRLPAGQCAGTGTRQARQGRRSQGEAA